MNMECPECREDMLGKIGDVESCAKNKLSVRNFGIAVFCLCAPVMAYLISLNVMVAGCADEESVNKFEKVMIEQVTKIQEAVSNQAVIFDKYVERTERRDKDQEVEIDKLDERVRDLEHD